MSEKISKAVIKRLPRYYRYLTLLKEKGIERVSSKELSEMLKSTASQVRQDFNNFGGFGQQGYGYKVADLLSEIERILGLGTEYKTIVVGSGSIGQAIAKHSGFGKSGFVLKAMFDSDPSIIGSKFNDIEVSDYKTLDKYLSNNKIDIAYICVGLKEAQTVAEQLDKGGVKAVFNFAPTDLKLSDNVIVKNVHLVEELFYLSYYLNGEAR